MCCICPYKNSCKYIKDVCKSKKIFFTLYEKVIQEVWLLHVAITTAQGPLHWHASEHLPLPEGPMTSSVEYRWMVDQRKLSKTWSGINRFLYQLYVYKYIYIYILWLHNIYINILWSIYSILIYIILYLLSFNYFYIFSSNLYEIAARLPTAMSWDPLRPHASQLQCRRKRPSKVLIHRSRKSNKKLSFGRKYRDSMWFRYSENAFWDWVKYIEIYWFPGLICWQMFQIWVWVGGESPTGTHLRGIPGIILKSNN